jgi:hypothetical protein
MLGAATHGAAVGLILSAFSLLLITPKLGSGRASCGKGLPVAGQLAHGALPAVGLGGLCVKGLCVGGWLVGLPTSGARCSGGLLASAAAAAWSATAAGADLLSEGSSMV